MMDVMGARRLAVLIDGDNISADYADQVFEAVIKLGVPRIRRVYGASSALGSWKKRTGRFMIGRHQVLPGKNAADMKLAIDAVDILHRQKVDGFCIASSDRDFSELAMHLKRHGAYVVGLGEKNAAASYRNACDHFFTLKPKAPPVADAKRSEKPLQPPLAAKSKVQNAIGDEVAKSSERKQIAQQLKVLAKGRLQVPVSELGNHLPKAKRGGGKLRTRLKAHGFTLVVTKEVLMVEVPRAA